MDRSAFKRKTLNGQRPRVDRFVAARASFPELRRRLLWVGREQTVDIWYQKDVQRMKYTRYIDEAFGLEPLKDCRLETREGFTVESWPCVPRKRGYLSSADSILDLPTYSYAAFPELLDWSNDNILVAALGRNYHKWSWRTQSLISQGFAQHEIQCCKFDPRGEMLILGTDMKMFEIHNNLLSKWVGGNCCRCLKEEDELCSITAIDWSPTGNSFITGCSRGMLVSFDRDARLISWLRASRTAILMVRVSPDARYVAATTVNAATVNMFTWPDLNKNSSLSSDWIVKGASLGLQNNINMLGMEICCDLNQGDYIEAVIKIASRKLGVLNKTLSWHPWRSALLGVGAVSTEMHAEQPTVHMQARIALWDAPSTKVRETNLGRNHYSLDVMLFSHRTGELVLSLWDADPATSYQKTCSRLVVMSDTETVVDQWGEGRSGLDRVRTMIFSPDGTKLATATADEDLIIWNFLPEDKSKKKKTNNRKFSAMPAYLDEAMHGHSLR